MNITATTAGAPVDDARLDTLQRDLGASIPAAYRAFLLNSNGGEPTLDHYPIHGMVDNPFGEIRMFLGVDAREEYDDLEVTRSQLSDRLPAELLAIGYSSGGDMICLSLRPSDYGEVFFWDSHAESDPASWSRSGYTNVYFVAKDFETFIASLSTYEAFAGQAPDTS
jgi:hypothetical protein